MASDPLGTEAEGYRTLRAQLAFARLDRDGRAVMIATPAADGKKTGVAANLAVALARAGRRVVLADADLAHPSLHRMFQLDGPGLADLLLGDARLEETLEPVAIGKPAEREAALTNGNGHGELAGTLRVLPAGAAGVTDVLEPDRLTAIVDELAINADVVLVDAPGLLDGLGAFAVASAVDAAVVVAKLKSLRRSRIAELRATLDSLPTRVLGVVVIGRSRERVRVDAPVGTPPRFVRQAERQVVA
jgi:Mrp family chromosome partitioning ATPase